jgi:hypothetical protein
MISELYKQPFQKSFAFLYPLLGFNKSRDIKPEKVYICFPSINLTIHDRKLICLYKKENTEKWRNFEATKLITHKMLDFCVPIDDENVIYIFDLNHMSADFDAFLDGKYSKLSKNAKKMITDYYGIHTPEWVYIESFLFPSKYFKQYAKLLDISEEILREGGELCNKYNPKTETCKLFVNQLN